MGLKRFLYVSFAIWGAALVFSRAAHAQEGAVTVSPAFVDVEITADELQKPVEFVYTNNSKSSVELEISAIDFRQNENGTVQFIGQNADTFSYALASFLSPEASTLVLDPGVQEKLTVVIRNREGLSPGGHYASVVATLKNRNTAKTGARVFPSISSLILVRKSGGERFNLSLISSDWPENTVEFSIPRSVQLTFQNEGNVHLVPYGTVEIRDMFGRLTHKGIINVSSLRVFPETRRRILADVHQVTRPLPAALYTVTVQGNDSLEKVKYTHKSSFIYVDPVYTTAVVISVVLFVWILIRAKRKKQKKSR